MPACVAVRAIQTLANSCSRSLTRRPAPPPAASSIAHGLISLLVMPNLSRALRATARAYIALLLLPFAVFAIPKWLIAPILRRLMRQSVDATAGQLEQSSTAAHVAAETQTVLSAGDLETQLDVLEQNTEALQSAKVASRMHACNICRFPVSCNSQHHYLQQLLTSHRVLDLQRQGEVAEKLSRVEGELQNARATLELTSNCEPHHAAKAKGAPWCLAGWLQGRCEAHGEHCRRHAGCVHGRSHVRKSHSLPALGPARVQACRMQTTRRKRRWRTSSGWRGCCGAWCCPRCTWHTTCWPATLVAARCGIRGCTMPACSMLVRHEPCAPMCLARCSGCRLHGPCIRAVITACCIIGVCTAQA